MSESQEMLPFDLPGDDKSPLVVAVPEYDDNPNAVRYEYPAPFEAQRKAMYSRLMARQALDRHYSEAYNELGGGVRPGEATDPLFEAAKDVTNDDRDIVAAFEHFNLAKLLEAGQFERMNVSDKKEVSLQFKCFVEKLESLQNVLSVEGSYPNEAFRDYQFTSDEDAARYAGKIESLVDAMSEYPAFHQLMQFARENFHSYGKFLRARRQIAKLDDFCVVYDTVKSKLHVHIEK